MGNYQSLYHVLLKVYKNIIFSKTPIMERMHGMRCGWVVPFRVKAVVAGVGAFIVAAKLYKHYKSKKLREEWNSKPGVVIVHDIPPAHHCPSLTPFSVKLQTFLRMTDIKYIVDTKEPLGPKKKVPWITLDGVDYADTEFIIEMLMKRYRKDPDQNLSKELQAVGLAMRVLFEDHLYWGLVHYRYIEDDLKGLFTVMDTNCFIRFMFRRFKPRIQRTLYGQGFGRHSTAEIHHLVRKGITSVANYLGDKDFMLGDEPHLLDCTAFAFINGLLTCCPNNPYDALVKEEYPQLEAYNDRMKARFWPDWNNCIARPE